MVGIANANNVMFDGILGLQFRFDVRCEYNKYYCPCIVWYTALMFVPFKLLGKVTFSKVP